MIRRETPDFSACFFLIRFSFYAFVLLSVILCVPVVVASVFYIFLEAAAPWTPRLCCWIGADSPDPPGETKKWRGSGPISGRAEQTALGP